MSRSRPLPAVTVMICAGEGAGVLLAGIRSQTKLVDLIEARDCDGAEQYRHKRMTGAGGVWLQGVGRASIVDLLH